ncbi:MAG TPA: pyridoxamine 5'-phosphate oxidase family protein [Myxococcota bacterium]|nr:pyridoxamine 5'-phosphate oxidase family protein [Myxococcota bacterium]
MSRCESRVPAADRPSIPGGYLEPKLLAWPWAEERLVRSRNYWVATTTAAGAPHARPVWGVWLDARLYFSSGSRIRRHLEARSAVSAHLESGDECVIVEGTASLLVAPDLAARVTAAYNEKYRWALEPRPGEFFEVRPRVVFGWLCDGSGLDGGALFSQTATRWRFA